MEIKTLAKAISLQEEIEHKTKVVDAINARNTKFDIWVKSDEGDEFSIMHLIPMDLKTQIIQAAKSAIAIELQKVESQFKKL